MKAMILAAGLGTRLRPLTDKKPKALVPVVNRPMIERVIEYLKGYGIEGIVVNTHHHYNQIVDYMDAGKPFGIKIDVLVEPEILGTGGAIKNTEGFWDDEPFIVFNSDVLTNIDLGPAYEAHRESKGLVTLILHDREPYNQISIDYSGRITDIAPGNAPGRLAFTGIHIISPEFLTHIPDKGFSNIIDCYLTLIHSGKDIKYYITEGYYWSDIGTVDSYKRVNKDLLDQTGFSIAPECQIAPSATLRDWAVIGERATLEESVEIRGSILWDGIRVKQGIKIVDSIVTSDRTVDRDLFQEVY
ncbi:MAG: NDP-sugar synthase [Deltaproteobacteria bacterium]|nr:NDP-sugar synthase [Deltaproteobacteria bacterium]